MTENHLFLLWNAAAPQVPRILDDIVASFDVVTVRTVHWDRELFSSNLSRFYGRKMPSASEKESHCGTGPFTVIVVSDESPAYDWRRTTSGRRRVNTRVFDAKQRYRDWTGGGHRVHASDSVDEARHDLALLFGVEAASLVRAGDDPVSWDGDVVEVRQDLAGARAWSDLRELFFVLNETTHYVVLRNFEGLLDSRVAVDDVDLLVEDRDEGRRIANARPLFLEPYRVQHQVLVGGAEVPFDLRYLGDDYYDTAWQRRLLEDRLLDREGFYRPTAEDYFFTLLYHALVHKQAFSAEYAEKLAWLAEEADVSGIPRDVIDERTARSVLNEYMDAHGFRFVRPRDLSVSYRELRRSPLPGSLTGARPTIEEAVAETSERTFWCREEVAGRVVRRTMSGDLATREAYFLGRLDRGIAPRVLASGSGDDHSWVDLAGPLGVMLTAARHGFVCDRPRRLRFFRDCLGILRALRERGIEHRDIRVENVRVRDGRPLLLGFGFALDESSVAMTPQRLGGVGRPPDGTFCDVHAMGKVFAYLDPGDDPACSQVIRLMTEPKPDHRVTDLELVDDLLASLDDDSATAQTVRTLLVNIAARDGRLERRMSDPIDDRLERLTHDLRNVVAPNQPFLLIDDDQLRSELPTGLAAVPFLERDGEYWGPPSDDVVAIDELRRMQSAGATAVALAWPSFWWFDHYRDFAEHLERNFPCLMSSDTAVVFDLSRSNAS